MPGEAKPSPPNPHRGKELSSTKPVRVLNRLVITVLDNQQCYGLSLSFKYIY